MELQGILDTDEKVVFETKQHRGVLVLIALLMPILIVDIVVFSKYINSQGNPLGCFACCGALFLLACLIAIPLYLYRKPELVLTNQRILWTNVGIVPNKCLLTDIKKVSVYQLVEMGNINFGHLVVKGKPDIIFAGLPEPTKFAEQLVILGVSLDKVERHSWQTRIVLALLLFYGIPIIILVLSLLMR